MYGKITDMQCNLCGCEEFIDMNVRVKVKCKHCGSLERTRLLWMYLSQYKIKKNTKILHLAPEKGIYIRLSNILLEKNYIIADFNPKKYPFAKNCIRIDLCDLDHEKSNQFDFIIHSHVLEHTPCNVAYTLFHLHRMLKRNGVHICIIPFMNGKYDESFQDLTDAEKTKRFGQFDHVRRFGKTDINNHLGCILNIPQDFDASKDFDRNVLLNNNIPESHWKGFHIGTVLKLRKNDYKLGSYGVLGKWY